jgi:hypothetical protein
MNINYFLIAISFIAPIVRILFSVRDKKDINARTAISEWLASGIMACLVQFIGIEFELLKQHEILVTVLIALSAKKVYTFVDSNMPEILRKFLGLKNKE